MQLGRIMSVADIAASGMAAERTRMEVAANNIANAHSTRSDGGGAFRRKEVHFAEAYNDAFGLPGGGLPAGVQVIGVVPDNSEMQMIYNPGHPDADAEGMVEMPNVHLPHEMVDLVSATRAYEANLKVLTTFREMAEQTLGLLRGISS